MDRDGTLNYDKSYLYKFEDFEWIDRVPEALARLKASGLALVVITNQSGINRGYFTCQDLFKLHGQVDQDLFEKVGFKMDGWYFCPHNPEIESCACRKPAPGLLQKASQELFLDPARSYMVGDKALDIKAGLAIGVKRAILVLTSYGQRQQKYLPPETLMVKDFPEAADFILRDFSQSQPKNFP
jgi:D-glycero-D-manno-heptose 1,7-bisphosphate phosphatase